MFAVLPDAGSLDYDNGRLQRGLHDSEYRDAE